MCYCFGQPSHKRILLGTLKGLAPMFDQLEGPLALSLLPMYQGKCFWWQCKVTMYVVTYMAREIDFFDQNICYLAKLTKEYVVPFLVNPPLTVLLFRNWLHALCKKAKLLRTNT